MNPDHRIDQVLTALNRTAAPEDLAERLNRSLASTPAASRMAARTSYLAPRTSFRPAFSAWLPATALALAAALLTAFLTTHHHSALPIAVNPAYTTQPKPSAHPTYRVDPSRRHAALASANSPQPPLPLRFPFPPRQAPTSEDTLALAETRAPSLPPPTLPLTADERLMQTIARRSDLPQLAELHTPDPPAPAIAPIFAGFAPRPDDDAKNDDQASLTIDTENQ